MVLPGMPRQVGVNGAQIYVPGMPWVSGGRYDASSAFGGQAGTGAVTADTLYALPLIPVAASRRFGEPVALDRIGIEVTTAGAASTKARLGLAQIGADGKPGALIVDAGEVAIDAIAGVEATIAVSVPSGVPIFGLIVCNGTPTLRTINVAGWRSSLSSLTDILPRMGWSRAMTYAALPNPFGGTPTATASVFRIVLRAA